MGVSGAHSHDRPLARGSALAIAAAILFGVVAPAVTYFGRAADAFPTAALLYVGAATTAALARSSTAERAVSRRVMPRIVLVAVLGAAAAPACFAWGLQRAGALAAALLLNFEAVFTLCLASLLHREPVGRRIVVASVLFVAGGSVLAMRAATGTTSLLGVGAVVAATCFWALDNALTRPLSDLDPRSVVIWKSSIGALISAVVAVASGEGWPSRNDSIGLLVCGAVGYGTSLRLYLRAQRSIGSGRTAALFSVGPFVGAVVAVALGERAAMGSVGLAGACFAAAAWLHATEAHAHRHAHAALFHEHLHTHDDGHHAHAHSSPVTGAHSHPHSHEALEHAHPHALDVHHRHEH